MTLVLRPAPSQRPLARGFFVQIIEEVDLFCQWRRVEVEHPFRDTVSQINWLASEAEIHLKIARTHSLSGIAQTDF